MPDAGWDSLVRQAVNLQEQGAETATQLKESAGRERDIAARLADMKPPAAPELKEPAPPPDPSQLPNPLTSFGSVAAALGMLGSLMTRRPLMTALNAATGAIVGAREGNQAEFKRQYDIWKEQSEYADKVQTWQTNRYKMIMDQYKTNVDQMLNALNVEALANKDLVAANLLQKGDLQVFESLLMDRANLHLRQQEVGLRMAEAKPILDATMDYTAARKELVAAQKTGDQGKIAAAQEKVDQALGRLGAIRGELTPSSAGKGLESQLMAQWRSEFQAKNGRAPTADEQMKRLQQLRTEGKPPTAADMRDEQKAAEVAGVLDLGDDTINMVEGTKAAVGLMGHLGRPLETIGNILEVSDDTTKRQIESNITIMRNTMVRLLNDRSIMTTRDRADAEKMIRGLELGSTVQNFESSVKTMQNLLGRKYKSSLERHGFLGGTPSGGGGTTGGGRELPNDLPDPSGHEDGSVVRDESGAVVAILRGGKWVPP